MAVESDMVRKVARLSRLAIEDGEVDTMTGEMNAILAWVEQLDEVDVENVEPMTSVHPLPMYRREDVVTDGEIVDQIVANAPAEDDNFFMVPKVVE